MKRMPTPDLDLVFGTVGVTDEEATEMFKNYAKTKGERAGKNDPREFYQWSNQATKHINGVWSTYTGIPVNSSGGRNQHKCVAKLLTQTPDVELIERAVRSLANEGRFGMGVDMYYLRKLVENEVSRLQAHDQRLADTDKYLTDETGTEAPDECPNCGRATYRPGEDCQWH